MTEGFHVIRTRTADSSVAHRQLAAPSTVGQVATSRTFPTAGDAQREADAWQNTGDWSAEVRPGRAPRAECGNRTCTRIHPPCRGRHT